MTQWVLAGMTERTTQPLMRWRRLRKKQVWGQKGKIGVQVGHLKFEMY